MEPCPQCGTYNINTATWCSSCNTNLLNSTTPKNAMAIPLPDKINKRTFGSVKLTPQTEEVIIQQNNAATIIISGLIKYYMKFVLPLEQAYRYDLFSSPSMNEIDFTTAPQVLLIGQYSVGKTSFINYLVEKNVMGSRVGVEPTTDKLTAVMYTNNGEERVYLGNAAAADKSLPFRHLQSFGTAFLNRFEVSLCNSPILKDVTFIDTPGVLSGEKQRINREYDFPKVVQQCASSASMILLMFDAHKLDISDEMRDCMLALKGQEDKLHIVLNKADGLTPQQLLRVYGSLMWSLGRVFTSPEALRVFIGSFWSQPYQRQDNMKLLEDEEAQLLAALRSLPNNHAIRIANETIKRIRRLRVHCLVIERLRSQFGFFTRKEKKQAELLEENRMISEFKAVQNQFGIPLGDFPNMTKFRETIKDLPMHEFPELQMTKIEKLDWVLSEGIPSLMRLASEKSMEIRAKQIAETQANAPPRYEDQHNQNDNGHTESNFVAAGYIAPENGVISIPSRPNKPQQQQPQQPQRPQQQQQEVPPQYTDTHDTNPFADDDNDHELIHWEIPDTFRQKWFAQFNNLKLVSGKLSGANAKPMLQQSGLVGAQLKIIWALSDIDRDGWLDADEYVLCQYLIIQTRNTGTIPQMTIELCPPSKRELFQA